MNILNYGDVIICRNIFFNDGACDIKMKHPGIVLLPTAEEDEVVYCLFRTSDQKRVEREKERYFKFVGTTDKESYVNLHQILNNRNEKTLVSTRMSDKEFNILLKKFYEYQTNIENPDPCFEKIKKEIETLICINEINIKYQTRFHNLSKRQLEIFAKINDEEKMKKIYKESLVVTGKVSPRDISSSQKQAVKYKKIREMYEKIKESRINNMNIEQQSKAIESIYLQFKSSCYFANIDELLEDLIPIFDFGGNNKISSLIKQFINKKKEEPMENHIKTLEDVSYEKNVNVESENIIGE